ncbi:MAG: phosphohydrolase [Treponema sp.]
MQKDFTKINIENIKEGMRFTAPVFFEDGKNMFLAEGKTIKPYHLSAIKRWQIPYLLTYGHVIGAGEDASVPEGLEELEPLEEL